MTTAGDRTERTIPHEHDRRVDPGRAGAGAAVGVGAQAIVLRNEKGATLELVGRQVGLQINADLSGLVISMR